MSGSRSVPYGTVRTLRAAVGAARRAADEWPGAYTHITEFVNQGTAQEYRREVAIIHEGVMFIARDPELAL